MRTRTAVRLTVSVAAGSLLLAGALAAYYLTRSAAPAAGPDGSDPSLLPRVVQTDVPPPPSPNQVEQADPVPEPSTADPARNAPEPPAHAPAPAESSPPRQPANPPAPEAVPYTPAPRTAPQLPGAISIIIENSWNSRPQSGLERADLVYEMEAEFGITRFLALYYWEAAAKIGPVRSARMQFYDVATAHGVPYAHVGGSTEVLRELKFSNQALLNLDEIYTCGGCFWRGTQRAAPHNVYTSTDLIVNHAKAAGFALKPLAGYAEGEAPEGGKEVSEVSFHWGPETQGVAWAWNGSRYLRSQSGGPHIMESGARIAADNLVLLFTSWKWVGNSNGGKGAYEVAIVGSGSGYLYRSGRAYPILWKKAARDQHFVLTHPDGSPVSLATGQTWFEILKANEHLLSGRPD